MSTAVVEKTTKKGGGGSSKRNAAPVKTTINLLIREKKTISPAKWIPGVLIVLILAAVFGKFAVADRYTRLSKAEADLAAKKQYVEETRAKYADYDEVREQYNRYTYTGYDRTIADRLDVLDLLERKVFPVCEVETASVSGKTVSLTLSDLNLDQVSQLIASLEAEPLVSTVYVSTTTREENTPYGTAVMTVELADADTLEGGADNE